MVSFKAFTLLTLTASIVSAIPQYGHSRFHLRSTTNDADLANPASAERHTRHHHHNISECGALLESSDINPSKVDGEQASPCLSGESALVTATASPIVVPDLRRWERSRHRGSWTRSADYTPPTSYTGADSAGVSTSSAAAPAASSSAATNVTSAAAGPKKGLSYNSNALLNQFSSAGASWAYNWGAGAGGSVPAGIEFVPMLWGRSGVSAWAGAVQTAINGGAKHVLSFNEPDFPEQANIPAAEAATMHIANMAGLKAKGIQVGSPSITNSNIKGQGLDWMTAFLAACGGAANNCKIDFLTFHWYNNPETFDNFKSHVNSVISLAKANGISKVWLTEFAVNGGTADQAAFLKQAIPFLDATPEVERYAYFMVGNGQMLTNGALNAVGQAYAS